MIIKRLYLEAIREPQLQPLVLPGRKGDAEVLYSLLRLVPSVRETLTFHAAYVWSVWIGGAIGYAQGRFDDADVLPYVRERLLDFSPCFFGVNSLD